MSPSLVPARDAEVGDLHRARFGEQHVAGLHVTVHDAAAMRERERRRDLGGDVGGLAGLERSFAVDQLAQRPTLDVLHHDEVRARLLAPVVDGDDVRVVEVRGGLRLAPEPLDERGLARELGEQRLQRDRPVQRLIACEVHLGHTAPGDLTLDLIAVGEDLADQGHGAETLAFTRRSDGAVAPTRAGSHCVTSRATCGVPTRRSARRPGHRLSRRWRRRCRRAPRAPRSRTADGRPARRR